VKYRREVFVNQEIIDELKKRTREMASNWDVSIKNQEVDKDYTRILFSVAPKTDLVKFIKALKGSTSRVIKNRFPGVEKKLWKGKFWSPSYFLATTGAVTLDVLKEYVESQGE